MESVLCSTLIFTLDSLNVSLVTSTPFPSIFNHGILPLYSISGSLTLMIILPVAGCVMGSSIPGLLLLLILKSLVRLAESNATETHPSVQRPPNVQPRYPPDDLMRMMRLSNQMIKPIRGTPRKRMSVPQAKVFCQNPFR